MTEDIANEMIYYPLQQSKNQNKTLLSYMFNWI
jgi:hypothetical protein